MRLAKFYSFHFLIQQAFVEKLYAISPALKESSVQCRRWAKKIMMEQFSVRSPVTEMRKLAPG